MKVSDYTSGETVGELIDRLGGSFSAMIEAAKERALNLPAERIITILTMVGFLMLLVGGIRLLEIFIKDKREHRSLRQKNNDGGDPPA